MEVLTNMLNSRFVAGHIGYHPLGRNLTISHLAFADDLMIFYDGGISSIQEIASLLDTFKDLSGLYMNRDKSTLFVAGAPTDGLDQLGYPLGSLLVRYLGLPLLHRKLKKEEYALLLDKVKARFTDWSSKALSFAAFALPKGCLRAIEMMCNTFLWSGNITKRPAAKVSWKDICLPKKEGGLGLRNFAIWNKVLTMKLIWMLITNSGSLWVAWMKEHMLKNSDYWLAETNQGSSWIWRFLHTLKSMVKPLLTSSIGDGQTASFWYDNWCVMGPLINFLGLDGPRLMGIPREAKVAQGVGPHGWRLPSCRSRNPLLLTVRNTLSLLDPPSVSKGPDVFSWGQEGARKSFSVLNSPGKH
ncbi:PREDICTED: uncharacterized protein LOC104789260 [Camelina sativa]|uniref:Uncharacterized protein LOC104789260 n=1 Tax=Camelina sativa TaxID=90675 RepID=A0ABM0ZBJ7_CAMSA|nr:PREDICTED: uncharacterized protein LOC104789260 [Camelina sativa]